MVRTGHRSAGGVRVYKRSSDKLKELSSNVLNQGLMNKNTKMEDSETEDKVSLNPSDTVSGQPKMDTDTDAKVSSGTVLAQPVMVPKMDFGNASNITINFNYYLPRLLTHFELFVLASEFVVTCDCLFVW